MHLPALPRALPSLGAVAFLGSALPAAAGTSAPGESFLFDADGPLAERFDKQLLARAGGGYPVYEITQDARAIEGSRVLSAITQAHSVDGPVGIPPPVCSGAQEKSSIVDALWAIVRPAEPIDVLPWRHRDDARLPADEAGRPALVATNENTAHGWFGGATTAMNHIAVALPITPSASIGARFPCTFQDAARLCVLGPHTIHSAFGGLSNGRAFNDQPALGGATGADGNSPCGRRVAPHGVVLPLQPGLVDGKDTWIECALTEVRGEAQP